MPAADSIDVNDEQLRDALVDSIAVDETYFVPREPGVGGYAPGS
jgi:hypothetical protein